MENEKEMSEKYTRYKALYEDMKKNGGFNGQQAVYLIDLLDRYIPLV